MDTVIISPRGARRWRRGHPWIYRSDVEHAHAPPGVVRVEDSHGNYLGQALWSPPSEISLRFLTAREEPVDSAW
ncbi:MAG: hypothetical protein V3T28_01430, partial [Gemmatimonadales bacterium]